MSDPPGFDCSRTGLDKGVTLLEASAGTGKTYALARIFLRLVAEKGVEVAGILTVTFTTAATEELRDRIRSLLVEALDALREEAREGEDETIARLRSLEGVSVDECIRRISLAVTCFDEAVINTIHGFCNHVLRENSFETETLFEAELDQGAAGLALEGTREYWRERFSGAPPLISAAASTRKIKPDELARFFNGLPHECFLAFEPGDDFETARSSLEGSFDALARAWADDKEEYSHYVTNCVYKYTAHKNRERFAEILDRVFGQGEVSPMGLEILEYMRASKLRPLMDYREREKPVFALRAEEFWSCLERFGRAVRADCSRYLEDKVEKWKRDRGVLSFGDLLSLTARAVVSPESAGDALRRGLRQSFGAALIDEFQDTDPLQFEIFRELFGNTGEHWLYLIGDPKQSIYRFRGADLEAYFAFARQTKAVKYSLDTNYRTVTPLVEGINAFFSKSEEPFLHPDLPFSEVRPNRGGPADGQKTYAENGGILPPLVIRELESTGPKPPGKPAARQAIRVDVANEIHRLLAEGEIGGQRVRPRDVAVLVRGNWEARETWEYFRTRGLPSVVFSDVSLFESDEAKELLWVLEGLVDCHREPAIRRALATGLLGRTSEDFQAWQEDPGEWDHWVGFFRECHLRWRKEGVYVALRRLFQEAKAIPNNLARPDGERRVTNFLHLAEVLHHATSVNPLSPSSVVVWLRARIEDRDLSGEEYQLRLESESEAIRILTVHKSKGLEYPIVFLPSLSFTTTIKDKHFKYHREDGTVVVDLYESATEEALEKGKLEDGQEDARVLYVGLTRSASRCYLYHAPISISENARLPAQVRMMRSWAVGEGHEPSPGNGVMDGVESWIADHALNNQVEASSFSPGQSPADRDWVGDPEGETDPAGLRAQTWTRGRQLPGGSIVSSFSGLTKQVDFDGRDYDGQPEDAGREDQAGEDGEKPPIFDFPAGAHAGNLMHDVFEHLEFTDPASWEQLIARKLEDHQFDPDEWTGAVLGMVEQVMATELKPGLSVGSVDRSDRMEEMEFHFPVGPGFLPGLASALPEGCLLRRYLEGVDRSERHRIEQAGYLKGLVDLVFRAGGAYYVLDWKSNRLSGSPDGFGPNELEREMLDHHYVLQYHLYVVATHRFLRSRLAGYSYGEHFGGVYYLFTRGMKTGSQSGIFYDLPDLSVVEALENHLARS